jgi:serine/threonine protein phosphatase 1
MVSSNDGVQTAARERPGFFGRTASALRARLKRGFRRADNDTDDNFQTSTEAAPPVPFTREIRAPEGVCLYAVGDIHGRRDLLDLLMEQIAADAETLPEGIKPQVIFLGDYIDRGLKSRDVIEYFASGEADRFDPVFLMGNHEEALLRFLDDADFGNQWARYGGAETLYSYGLAPPNQRASLNTHEEMKAARDAWTKVWTEFRSRLPESHLTFFQSLKPYHVAGDYLFVHAGLRPGVKMEAQSSRDMMWIRDEFLDDRSLFPQMIVHGHTPMDTVHHDGRRIGLDTGAFLTGRLTAARLTGTDVAFLTT